MVCPDDMYPKLKIYISEIILDNYKYRGADKSLSRPGRKQATATEDFDFHISYF